MLGNYDRELSSTSPRQRGYLAGSFCNHGKRIDAKGLHLMKDEGHEIAPRAKGLIQLLPPAES
jgi:hypothetical protein